MSAADVVSCVRAAGLPVVRMAWPKGSAPPLPWCAFYLEETRGFCSDNELYAPRSTWVVELYQRSSDPEVEAALERSIASTFGPYDKTDAWIEDEGCIQTAYRFAQIENQEVHNG